MTQRNRGLVVGMLIALAAHLVAAGLVWSVFGRLPELVVSHWGPNGPDGFVAKGHTFWVLLGSLGFTVLFTLLVAAVTPRGEGATVAGLGAAMGVFLAVLLGGTTVLQSGTTSAGPLEFQSWWLLPAVTVAILTGIASSSLVGQAPPRPNATRIPPHSARLPEEDPRRTWNAIVASSPGFLLILLLPVPVFLIVAFAMQDWLLPLVFMVLVAIPLLGMWRWRIGVDADGLSVVGHLGWPRLHRGLHEIEEASVLERVEAMEYGGPGLRMTSQGARLALRSGPGLRLELSDCTDFIATVPGADTAARTLNTLIGEQRER